MTRGVYLPARLAALLWPLVGPVLEANARDQMAAVVGAEWEACAAEWRAQQVSASSARMRTSLAPDADMGAPSETVIPAMVPPKPAARLLGVDPRTLRRWREAGLVEGRPAARGHVYDPAELRRVAQERGSVA